MKRRIKKKKRPNYQLDESVIDIPIAQYLKRLEDKIDFNREFLSLKFEKEEFEKKRVEFHKIFLRTNREFNEKDRELKLERKRLEKLEKELKSFQREKLDIEAQREKLEQDFLKATEELHEVEIRVDNKRETLKEEEKLLKQEREKLIKERENLLKLKSELEEIEKRVNFERTRLQAKHSNINPYEVLGLKSGAMPNEIKSAYRNLLSLYHPDKVHHLGDELKRVAELKTEEIMQSYREIMDKKI